MITQTELKRVLDYNPGDGVFRWKIRPTYRIAPGTVAGWGTGYDYRCIMFGGKTYRSHRLAWLYIYGEFPSHEIDHINGDRSDNRIENLRDVTKFENQRNAKKRHDNTSGVTGVRRRHGKWYARIFVNSKDTDLGFFDDWFNAVCARKAAEHKHSFHPNHGRS